jgi:hypothetical protein
MQHLGKHKESNVGLLLHAARDGSHCRCQWALGPGELDLPVSPTGLRGIRAEDLARPVCSQPMNGEKQR